MVPLACLEPRRWADQQFGMPRTGSHWARFRSESLQALRAELIARGSGLWVSGEEPVYALNRINPSVNVIKMVCDRPLATEERLENARIEAEGYPVVTHDVDDLFRFEQLPFELDELPATFSKFRKIVEKNRDWFRIHRLRCMNWHPVWSSHGQIPSNGLKPLTVSSPLGRRLRPMGVKLRHKNIGRRTWMRGRYRTTSRRETHFAVRCSQVTSRHG